MVERCPYCPWQCGCQHKTLSDRFLWRMIGYYSDRYIPSMQNFLADYKQRTSKVSVLVVKLRKHIPISKRHTLTLPEAKFIDATRWRPSFRMVGRYQRNAGIYPSSFNWRHRWVCSDKATKSKHWPALCGVAEFRSSEEGTVKRRYWPFRCPWAVRSRILVGTVLATSFGWEIPMSYINIPSKHQRLKFRAVILVTFEMTSVWL